MLVPQREAYSMYKRLTSRDYASANDMDSKEFEDGLDVVDNTALLQKRMVPDVSNPSWKLSLPHVLVATISSFLFGYHLGVVNEPLESISADLGFKGNALAEGLVVSTCLGGAFIGSLFSVWIADGVGRRRAFQLCALPMIIGAVMRKVICGETVMVGYKDDEKEYENSDYLESGSDSEDEEEEEDETGKDKRRKTKRSSGHFRTVLKLRACF